MSLLQMLLPSKPFGHHRPHLRPTPLTAPKLASFRLHVASAAADPSVPPLDPKSNPPRGRRRKPKSQPEESAAPVSGKDASLPTTIPRKPRRGRRSEAAAVEDFVRNRLEQTFAAIREQDAGVLDGKAEVLKQWKIEEEEEEDEEEEEKSEGKRRGKVVVEEEDPNWPLDADVGWGIRASEYFEKHPIKNVVDEGLEIDWEGEMDEGWVKEINCLEWESFAFHPSPLIVLVFERYSRAAVNWRLLKELEKAAKVYWSAKDRLPPRTVKIDINIERDLAYALKVKDCPELLFLKGNTILYREKELKTSEELVQMIAHFYYNAKRPSFIDAAKVYRSF